MAQLYKIHAIEAKNQQDAVKALKENLK